MAIAALVCGILGIVGGFIPVVNYFTLVLAILGIVFGVKARKQSAEAQDGKQGMATAGLVWRHRWRSLRRCWHHLCSLCRRFHRRRSRLLSIVFLNRQKSAMTFS